VPAARGADPPTARRRALSYELHGLTASELGRDFDLDRMLHHGFLPRIYKSSRPRCLRDA